MAQGGQHLFTPVAGYSTLLIYTQRLICTQKLPESTNVTRTLHGQGPPADVRLPARIFGQPRAGNRWWWWRSSANESELDDFGGFVSSAYWFRENPLTVSEFQREGQTEPTALHTHDTSSRNYLHRHHHHTTITDDSHVVSHTVWEDRSLVFWISFHGQATRRDIDDISHHKLIRL